MVREILIWPDPRLREKASDVKAVDAGVRKLVDDMFETMYAANGVGLAAPQVGVLHRVIVIDTSPRQEKAKPVALINPVIVKLEGEVVYSEGCLSIPGESEEVDRAEKAWVQALDREGQPLTIEAADGLLAIALQHEIDHLDGTLFVDHISALKRELIKRRMKRLKAEREEDKRTGRKAKEVAHGGLPAL
jgi:peptide deformylase